MFRVHIIINNLSNKRYTSTKAEPEASRANFPVEKFIELKKVTKNHFNPR